MNFLSKLTSSLSKTTTSEVAEVAHTDGSILHRIKKALLLRMSADNHPYWIDAKTYRPAPAEAGVGNRMIAIPEFMNYDIRFWTRDARRAPIIKKVITPYKLEDNTDVMSNPAAQVQSYNNPIFPPEYRNLATTSGSQPWIYQADKLVSKYKKLDVPPPFGKASTFKKPTEVANLYKDTI